ncbi:hypothetical protein OY671_013016, partial [Metschnikowia pulcherrima]
MEGIMARYGIRTITMLTSRCTVAAGASAFASAQAVAQQASAAPPTAAAAADNGDQADIVVTAQKRAERSQDVPI